MILVSSFSLGAVCASLCGRVIFLSLFIMSVKLTVFLGDKTGSRTLRVAQGIPYLEPLVYSH